MKSRYGSSPASISDAGRSGCESSNTSTRAFPSAVWMPVALMYATSASGYVTNTSIATARRAFFQTNRRSSGVSTANPRACQPK
jgi:hypothetical protein